MTELQTDDNRQAIILALFAKYSELSNGDKASIRKTVEPDDLQLNPVFYHLIQDVLNQFKEENKAKARDFFKNLLPVARLIYFLPYLQHQANNKSLGGLLKEKNISERRLFLVMRSEYPQDLIQLRRLCQQVKGAEIDGFEFGKLLLFWGKNLRGSELSKRQLMKNYYLNFDSETVEVTADADY